jgi:peptide/nickel transport system substrate-binding protein
MKNIWKSAAFIVCIVLALAIAGCGSEQTSSPSGTSSKGSSTSNNEGGSETKKEEGPAKGGTVSIPIVGDPIFNPWHPNAFAESNLVNRVLFSGLTKPGKDLAPSPDLAIEWSASEDGLQWTFKLREGVKWHDGKPFTADDVVFTFNDVVLNAELGTNGASNFKEIERVEVIDPLTVVFHMKNPMASLPARLGFNAQVIPKHIFEGQDPWNLNSFNKENPVGTGPFKIGKYLSGQQVELVANSEYFEGAPHLDSIKYKILPDANTHIAQALSNELTIFTLDDKAALKRMEQSQNLSIHPQDVTRYFWIALNQENPLFTDVKVRQAFLHAIDRQAIIDTVLQGYAKIADAAITPNMETYYTADVARYDYNPAKAKELLASLGWIDSNGDGILDKDGKKFSFEFDIAIQGELEPVAQMVQQYLKEIGLDVKLNVLEWNAMIQKNVIKRDYDMMLNWWRYASDPDVLPQYHSTTAGKGYNIPGYKDAKLDELLEAGQKTSDPEERQKIYYKVQQHMAETLPYLYLWYPQEIQVRNQKLQGVPDMAFGDTLHYVHEWWLEQ